MNPPGDARRGRSRGISDATLLRWAPKAYLAVAVGLVPWVVYLAVALPRRATAAHYRLAWVGFDCFLALALARTAYLGYRRRPQAELTAVVTATLLLVDAWFDVTTSPTTADLWQAVILATFAEIPAALASLYLVRRVDRIIAAQLEVAATAEHSPPADSPADGVGVTLSEPGEVRLELEDEDPPAAPVG
ncbi:hypothetical protein K6U06_04750 [Acidiferrimicrobium sp. IK]|uniref:hypothetical protein n=1 Tax=Acidiferrimicrobium sp. IK TaxID=2871700 RepID=UPI0021CB8D26|nr:hypothetical protein [Acidiferrimicrobium sp. IK]MCU4183658.1 hypothetical protein [Acidiferrimicrobium sp. IK]